MSDTPDHNPFESPRTPSEPPVVSTRLSPAETEEGERARRKMQVLALGCLVVPLAFAIGFGCCCTLAFALPAVIPNIVFDYNVVVLFAAGIVGGTAAATAVSFLLRKRLQKIDIEYDGHQVGNLPRQRSKR